MMFLDRVLSTYAHVKDLVDSLARSTKGGSKSPYRFSSIAALAKAYADGAVGISDRVSGIAWCSPYVFWYLPSSYSPFRLETQRFNEGDKYAALTMPVPSWLPTGFIPYINRGRTLFFAYPHDTGGFGLELSPGKDNATLTSSLASDAWMFSLDTGNANYGQHTHLWQYTVGDPEIARKIGLFARQPASRIPDDPATVKATIAVPHTCLPIPAYVPDNLTIDNAIAEISGTLVPLDNDVITQLSTIGAPISEKLFSAFYRPDLGLRPIAIQVDAIKPIRHSTSPFAAESTPNDKLVTLMVELFFEIEQTGYPVEFTEDDIIDRFLPAVKDIVILPRYHPVPDRWIGRIYGFDGPIYIYKSGPFHVSISHEGPLCIFTSSRLGRDYAVTFAVFREFVSLICNAISSVLGSKTPIRPCFTFMSDQWQLTFGKLLSGSAIEIVRQRRHQASDIIQEINPNVKPETKIRVLYLAANAFNDERIGLDEEIRSIRDKMRGAPHEQLIDITERWAVRADDLLHAMNQIKPMVVHFSGHGNEDAIIVKKQDGSSHEITTDALVSLFKVVGSTQVVILNACLTDIHAEAITEHVPCTIGMSDTIDDVAAIVFASSLYRALAFGTSVKGAFDQAVVSLKLEGIPDHDIPRLYTRSGIDPSLIILTEPF